MGAMPALALKFWRQGLNQHMGGYHPFCWGKCSRQHQIKHPDHNRKGNPHLEFPSKKEIFSWSEKILYWYFSVKRREELNECRWKRFTTSIHEPVPYVKIEDGNCKEKTHLRLFDELFQKGTF